MTAKPIALTLVLTLFSFSTVQASGDVRWTDLPKKIGRGKVRSDGREDRQYRVVTKDGLVHAGHKLIFSPNGVRLSDSSATIQREQVAEITVHRDARLRDALVAPGSALFTLGVGHDEYWLFSWRALLLPVLIPATLVVMAAAAPVVLPVHAVKRHLPDKVIRVAP